MKVLKNALKALIYMGEVAQIAKDTITEIEVITNKYYGKRRKR